MIRRGFLLACLILLSACQVAETRSESSQLTPTLKPTKTLETTNTVAVLTVTPSSSPTITPEPFIVCSPLEDENFESLPLIISKPLDIPPFGQDTGHHGVDYAYFKHGDRESIEGIEIYAILPGSVVLTLEDNYPYGYAVMVETPLSKLPPALQETLMAGYQSVPDDPGYRLYCPEVTPPQVNGEYSLYHLYAHFQEHSDLKRGDAVNCGDLLGTVGNTGYSSNPHLHLETRLGPSGASLETMAHYQNTATIEQMSNYCLWRMSGYYQLFDPEILFNAIP